MRRLQCRESLQKRGQEQRTGTEDRNRGPNSWAAFNAEGSAGYPWENLHLIHDEIDYGLPHTIVELDRETLTEAGKEAWADVLDAKVLRVYKGYFGLQMELSMLAHMIACHSESRIDEGTFRRLHATCVEEVRRLNGAVDLDDAYKYQKREN